jgi:hypothetical protein
MSDFVGFDVTIGYASDLLRAGWDHHVVGYGAKDDRGKNCSPRLVNDRLRRSRKGRPAQGPRTAFVPERS